VSLPHGAAATKTIVHAVARRAASLATDDTDDGVEDEESDVAGKRKIAAGACGHGVEANARRAVVVDVVFFFSSPSSLSPPRPSVLLSPPVLVAGEDGDEPVGASNAPPLSSGAAEATSPATFAVHARPKRNAFWARAA
jgi:hypothetical protein